MKLSGPKDQTIDAYLRMLVRRINIRLKSDRTDKSIGKIDEYIIKIPEV